MKIDVEAESRALSERSTELARMLEAAIPVVDKSAIREALAESRRLALVARKARDDVAQLVRRGQSLPVGCVLGVQPPIRRVPSGAGDRRAYDVLQGRAVVTPELVDYWIHRRDVVGPAIVSAYQSAAEALTPLPPLLAAARGHIALLRQRQSFPAENGEVVLAALAHCDAARGELLAGVNDGEQISTEAVARLEILRGEGAAAKIQGHGADWVTPWVAGKIASALELDVVDVNAPLGASPPARVSPVATRSRSTSSWRAAVEPMVRSSLPSAAEPVEVRFYPDAGVVVKSDVELR
jgi:hypothetical protein